MAKSGMKLKKRLPDPKAQFAAIRKEVIKTAQDAADRRAGAYAETVDGWKPEHRPKFKGIVVVTQRTVDIRVIIQNASQKINKYGTTIKMLWNIWNFGSKPHKIVPRFKSLLRFKVGGQWFSKKEVNHPGTRGNRAKERIDEQMRPKELKILDEGYRRGFKRLINR